MTERGRYLRGFGVSLLVHGVLVGTAFWALTRPPPKPKPEPTRWEVNMFKSAELPPPVAEDTTPPEAEPEPVMGDLAPLAPPAAPANPSQMPGFAAPSFDMPKLAVPTGAPSVGAIAIPSLGLGGGGMGPPGTGGGSGHGGRSQAAPDLGGGLGLSPIVRIPPTYPVEARRRKIEGWVRVEMTVLENGSVADVKVKSAEPAGVFEQAAVAAISQWKFSPAMENGKPVRRRAGQTLKFELDK